MSDNTNRERTGTLAQLLRNTRKRAAALADLEEVFGEVFGHDAGAEPDVYADYDRCLELQGKMRRAIDALRTT